MANVPRVLITGVGAVSPLGIGVRRTWRRLLAGASGLRLLTPFMNEDTLPRTIHNRADAYVSELAKMDGIFGFVPKELNAIADIDDGPLTAPSSEVFRGDDTILTPSQLRTMSRTSHLALLAAQEAFDDAGLKSFDPFRASCVIGLGMTHLPDISEGSSNDRLSPHYIPSILPNLPCGHVAMHLGLKGPSFGLVSACATGLHAIGAAYDLIRCGRADLVVCGASDACLSRLGARGFSRMRALSKTGRSLPLHEDRDGFIMSEGSAIVILENADSFKKRGDPYAEILGFGATCDAHHVSAPDPSGVAIQVAMETALTTHHPQHVNLHATGTPLGDEIELEAVDRVIQGRCQDDKVRVSATKASTGHLLGAAGSLETIFTALACRDGVVSLSSC